MSGDPRLEAAANALHHYEWTQLPGVVDQARAALAAADDADREAGIHRVKVDDETVERVARKLASFREAEWAFDVEHPSESYARAVRFKYIDEARAVLSALTEAES